MLGAQVLGELALERLGLRAGAEPARAQGPLDRLEVLRLDPDVEDGNLRRGHAGKRQAAAAGSSPGSADSPSAGFAVAWRVGASIMCMLRPSCWGADSITASSLDVLEQALEQRPAALGVGLLAAAEHDRHLDLVAVAQEALDVTLLGLVVVVGDLRAQLDLAHVDLLLVLAGGLRLLLLLVLVLRVIEQPGDRRARVRRHLDQVEIALGGHRQGLVGLDDADLAAVLVDQADLGDADALVDPRLVALRRLAVESPRDRH